LERLPARETHLSTAWHDALQPIGPVDAPWLDHPEDFDRMMRRRVRSLTSASADAGPVLAELVELTRVRCEHDPGFRDGVQSQLVGPLRQLAEQRPEHERALERTVQQLVAIASSATSDLA
jgi:hypothetical protein